MKEIHIRRLAYDEAQMKLERELNEAFVSGSSRVHVVHGVGTGKLRELTRRVVSDLGFGRVVDRDDFAYNPGVTVVDLFPPDRASMRQYMKR